MVTQNQNKRIAQQIEQTADYYPPANYSGSTSPVEPTPLSYLTYFNQITVNADALADQFIPLSTVPQRSRNTKLFAIGVIPPSASITGRLLDRSASINSVLPTEPSDVNVQTPSGEVSIVNNQASQAPKQFVNNQITKLSENQARDALREGFFKVTGQYPTDQVLALLMAQSAHETAQWTKIHNNNFGNIKSTSGWGHQTTTYPAWETVNGQRVNFPAGVPETQFRAYPDASEGAADYVIVLLKDNPRRKPPDAWKQALLTGDPAAMAVALKTPPPYYTGPQKDYETAMRRLYNQYLEITQVSPDSYNGNWQGKGSDNAQAAANIQDKTSNTPLVDAVTQQFTDAQRAQILDVQHTLDAMQNIPPLRMLVNPSSFSVKGEKICSDGGWSRNGNTIVEHWGNNQEKISAGGKVAGFYAIDFQNAVGPGLTRMARNYSQAWQNFQSLVLLYNNNGGLYNKDPTTGNQERNLTMLGSIYIYYDGILYIGAFDSLTVTETDTAPHTAEYNFEFTVRAAFLLDNPNPQDTGTYGSVQQNPNRPLTSATVGQQ